MHTDRDTDLLALRPAVPADLTADTERSPGHFMHATLRPICKLQNELLLHLFRQYIHKTKDTFRQLSPAKRLEFIAHSIQRDLRFRSLLSGVVIGHFTEAEWRVFAAHEQELSRRLSELLIQRLSDQVERLM